MNINFSNIAKSIMPFFLLIGVVYILNSILYFYLPKKSVEINKSQNIVLKYRNFNIKKMFDKKKVVKKVAPPVVKKEYQLLKNLKLNAIYFVDNYDGWIVVFDKKNNKEKTHILSINDDYKGYRLIKLYKKYVIFKNKDKEYKLLLGDSKNANYTIEPNATMATHTNTAPAPISANNDANIVVLDDKVSVKRAYLNSYINNFDKIWRDIAIVESRDKQGNIDGFKVTSINNGSPFEKLGLHTQDVIQSVNNVDLNSYNAAFGIYKNINNIEDLNIRIKRNNKTMELNYEIK
jgi:general secretion pathway protein C